MATVHISADGSNLLLHDWSSLLNRVDDSERVGRARVVRTLNRGDDGGVEHDVDMERNQRHQ